jgi:hypothetical protein
MELFKKLFRPFDDGSIFKFIVVLLFVLGALAALLNAAVMDFNLLRMLKEARFLMGMAVIVLAAAIALASLGQALVLAFRGAAEVLLQRDEKYSLVRLFAKVLRTAGESYFLFLLLLSPGGCLAIWLGGADIASLIPVPGAEAAGGTFLAGLFLLVAGVLVGPAQLFVTYLVAELVELLASIANDVSAMRAAKGA